MSCYEISSWIDQTSEEKLPEENLPNDDTNYI